MKRQIRQISRLLVMVLIVTALAGCGKSSKKKEKDPEPTAAAQTPVVTEEATPTPEDTPTPTPEIPQASLKEIYGEHGMRAGTCLTAKMVDTVSQRNLILEQFNSVTMENSMKPDAILNKKASIEAGDLVVTFNADMEKMLKFAKENNLGVRGHTIVWHSQTPNWIFFEDFDEKKSLVSREVMLARLESYIKQIFEKLEEEGYLDIVYAYDVANECWMEDGSMRDSYWKQTIGEDYLWYAFYYADKYAPESMDLYYNDYNEQFKTQTLIQFAKTLVDGEGNYLIDGIGFQAHLYTEDDLVAYFETVDAVSALGLKIELTELDVSLGAYQKNLPATQENLQIQGRFYYDLVHGLLERVDAGTLRMDALTFWGFADHLSWRKNASPLLYNVSFKPKMSYYGAAQMREYAGFED